MAMEAPTFAQAGPLSAACSPDASRVRGGTGLFDTWHLSCSDKGSGLCNALAACPPLFAQRNERLLVPFLEGDGGGGGSWGMEAILRHNVMRHRPLIHLDDPIWAKADVPKLLARCAVATIKAEVQYHQTHHQDENQDQVHNQDTAHQDENQDQVRNQDQDHHLESLHRTSSAGATVPQGRFHSHGTSGGGDSVVVNVNPNGRSLVEEINHVCNLLRPSKSSFEVLQECGIFSLFPAMVSIMLSGRFGSFLSSSLPAFLSRSGSGGGSGSGGSSFGSGCLGEFRNYHSHPQPQPGLEYLSHVSQINQILTLGGQLEEDVQRQHNHKYIAHQLALLYQCLNQVRGETKVFKRRIETRFEEIKHQTEQQPAPILSDSCKRWLRQLITDLREVIARFPPSIRGKLSAVQQALETPTESDAGSRAGTTTSH
ncbi:hypothetical protein CBR_g3841 [Chara braunii]|uniref:Uncharacterized protein n=1 Tax=Chara braunii TaxID=69332 RepID=A0A388KGG5_CHABU|nr:hypothetical protein CBR_g3841 [Chara braunii]|eukprot:GBG69142.1 hypothetical protein CBR_g3841 [Chara braunii]